MSFGVLINDASGAEVLKLDRRLPRYLGTIALTVAAGSATDARLAGGTPWFWLNRSGFAIGTTPGRTVTFSGTTISWSAGDQPQDLNYGLY